MKLPEFADHRAHFTQIRTAVLSAGDPYRAIQRHLDFSGGSLTARSFSFSPYDSGRIYLIAIGKAAGAMTEAVLDILGPQIHAGVVTFLDEPTEDFPPQLKTIKTGHPLPDAGSISAGSAAQALLRETRPEDLVIVLISGGGSAMFELPIPGISLGDLITVNQALLDCGAPIQEINVIRRTLSQTKAGGLARMAAPAKVLALILSDVVGNQLTSIASGPTVLRSDRPGRAKNLMVRHGIWDHLPGDVQAALWTTRTKRHPAPWPKNIIIGSNRMILDAAASEATALGFEPRIIHAHMSGEAREIGQQMAHRLEYLASTGKRLKPQCLLMGGETTVTIRGDGRGGRNQEIALSASIALEDIENVALMSFATDGVDGPTDAAGGIITGTTTRTARAFNLEPRRALEDNNTYPILDAVGGLIRTGSTGTNLNDL
ncbi:MAG: glycerate kinase, partial [Anaerolineales bacterium]